MAVIERWIPQGVSIVAAIESGQVRHGPSRPGPEWRRMTEAENVLWFRFEHRCIRDGEPAALAWLRAQPAPLTDGKPPARRTRRPAAPRPVNLVRVPDDDLVAELRRRGYAVTPPRPAEAPVDLETFRARLCDALARLDRELRQFGLVPIPQVREALADVATGSAFDKMILELAARREVWLVPHDHPASLSAEDLAGSIRDPRLGQVYYWFRRG